MWVSHLTHFSSLLSFSSQLFWCPANLSLQDSRSCPAFCLSRNSSQPSTNWRPLILCLTASNMTFLLVSKWFPSSFQAFYLWIKNYVHQNKDLYQHTTRKYTRRSSHHKLFGIYMSNFKTSSPTAGQGAWWDFWDEIITNCANGPQHQTLFFSFWFYGFTPLLAFNSARSPSLTSSTSAAGHCFSVGWFSTLMCLPARF